MTAPKSKRAINTTASSWIGVDLDGTLAHYTGWKGVNHIGEPVPEMVKRVQEWLAAGKTVKIFTARVHGHGMSVASVGGDLNWPVDPVNEGHVLVDAITPVQEWCQKHIGQVLEVTNIKDFAMVELWDDRAIQVHINTGRRADGKE